MYHTIENLVVELSKDPFNPEKNFACAVEYERLNQTASAASFYLRTAEYDLRPHSPYVYASLLKVAKCFQDQKDRIHTINNCLLQAVTYHPERREAYLMLSRFHELIGNWQDTYTWACLGLTKEEMDPLPVDVNYFGEYCLLFQKGVSAWWIGRKDESEATFRHLATLQMVPEYTNAVANNLKRLGIVTL